MIQTATKLIHAIVYAMTAACTVGGAAFSSVFKAASVTVDEISYRTNINKHYAVTITVVLSSYHAASQYMEILVPTMYLLNPDFYHDLDTAVSTLSTLYTLYAFQRWVRAYLTKDTFKIKHKQSQLHETACIRGGNEMRIALTTETSISPQVETGNEQVKGNIDHKSLEEEAEGDVNTSIRVNLEEFGEGFVHVKELAAIGLASGA